MHAAERDEDAAGSASAPAAAPPSTEVMHGEPLSLAHATRLVEPARLNNLAPEEIRPKHLRRATRAVRRTRGGYSALQHTGERLLHGARQEAVRGQAVAREGPGRRRALRVQRALRRAMELQALYDALQEERARFARRTAAARDLLAGWEIAHPTGRGAGRFAAPRLRSAILIAERHERLTRDRLDETRNALHHLAAAEEAMRRNSDEVRLDPVTFTRFAGRGRWGVRLGILVVLLAILAAIYPPWSPPHLALTCANGQAACAQLHAGTGLRLRNEGYGILFGWANVTTKNGAQQTQQIIPLILLPQGERQISCTDLNTCALTLEERVTVTISSTGGTATSEYLP